MDHESIDALIAELGPGEVSDIRVRPLPNVATSADLSAAQRMLRERMANPLWGAYGMHCDRLISREQYWALVARGASELG